AWEFEFRRGDESPIVMLEQSPRCDAIIGNLDGIGPRETAALRRRAAPTVLIEEYNDSGYPTVVGDNRAIGRLAFEHLRTKGFCRYAYFGWDGLRLFRERGDAFGAAVREAGLEFHDSPRIDHELISPEHEPWVQAWLRNLPKPIGVLAGNADLARRIVAMSRMMNLLVPEEVAVIGVDNETLDCELSWPPLSTIDHGMERAGYEAAALLHRMMTGARAPKKPIVVQPVSVIERQSTDTLAVEDPDVRAAVQLIRQRATQGLSVKDMLDLLPVTRRKLEIGFRRSLGRSIHSELTRVRLERAKLLLRTTEMAMPQIAAACGFEYASRLSILFVQTIGMTPTAYRRQQRGE
ncbi:MAG TPA: substrate-binding domain-containing protein, partial [Rhizomicrobium sp.]|nr:substrate-binding domain-containing protein [Rhizomicrobium sp.]